MRVRFFQIIKGFHISIFLFDLKWPNNNIIIKKQIKKLLGPLITITTVIALLLSKNIFAYFKHMLKVKLEESALVNVKNRCSLKINTLRCKLIYTIVKVRIVNAVSSARSGKYRVVQKKNTFI